MPSQAGVCDGTVSFVRSQRQHGGFVLVEIVFAVGAELVGVVLGEVEEGPGGLGEGAAGVPDEVDLVAGAVVGEVDDAGIFLTEGAVLRQRDAGDEGDDVAVAEVLEAGEEVLAAFEDDVWLEAGVLAEDVDWPQDVFGLWRTDERLVAEFGKILRLVIGDGALERGEHDVFVGAEDVAVAFLGQGARVGDGEVDLAVEELALEGGAGADGVMDDDVGMGFDEGGQPVFDVDRIDRADGDGVGLLDLELVDLGGDVVELAEDGLGVGEKDLAVVVEDDVAPLAVEEFGAELVLDAGEGVGEGGLGDAKLIGGFGDVLAFSDGDEILEL